MTSSTSRMAISWRLRKESSTAILVEDVMPFIFKVAIFIEATRSTSEGVGEGWGTGWEGVGGEFILCLWQAVTPSFRSSSVPTVLQCFFPISNF